MSDELFLDDGVCILRPADGLRICRELGIAIFTYARHRNIVLSFDDPKPACRRQFALFYEAIDRLGILQCWVHDCPLRRRSSGC